jgi:hypothetical protein
VSVILGLGPSLPTTVYRSLRSASAITRHMLIGLTGGWNASLEGGNLYGMRGGEICTNEWREGVRGGSWQRLRGPERGCEAGAPAGRKPS